MVYCIQVRRVEVWGAVGAGEERWGEMGTDGVLTLNARDNMEVSMVRLG